MVWLDSVANSAQLGHHPKDCLHDLQFRNHFQLLPDMGYVHFFQIFTGFPDITRLSWFGYFFSMVWTCLAWRPGDLLGGANLGMYKSQHGRVDTCNYMQPGNFLWGYLYYLSNICHLDASHVVFFVWAELPPSGCGPAAFQVGCCSTVVVVCWRSELTKLEICPSLPSSFLMPGALYLSVVFLYPPI